MEVVILSGADADMDEIYVRLDERGGGEAFLLAMDRKLELLRTFPHMAPRTQSAKVRKAKIGRTPFGVFYTVEGKRLMVVEVQDLRQDPRTLAKVIRARL
ncbi:MAG: type II toxin-antitoxin system RelE/ParE family toxin [Chthoniobacteraceae bacterium]